MGKPVARGQSSPGSPGVFGALKDAARAVASYASPPLVDRSKRVTINRAEREMLDDPGNPDLEERRRRQTSDHHN